MDPHLKSKHNKSNSYHPEWIKRIVQATSHPFFNPCTHSEPCSEETCSCIQDRFFCTKACIWGASSRNFFRGCNCSSKCTNKSCPCFASNRECDPDLCKRCGACSDPPNQPATTQKCRNDNVGMRRHVHLLLGKSRVKDAGWGLFTKHALKKGDYVHEYLGELITHNEAERRGKIYDDRNQTYIFDMSTDYAVDALKVGNKTRFINHKDNPNIEPQMKVVNGDYRIGFFASRDIKEQEEVSTAWQLLSSVTPNLKSSSQLCSCFSTMVTNFSKRRVDSTHQMLPSSAKNDVPSIIIPSRPFERTRQASR